MRLFIFQIEWLLSLFHHQVGWDTYLYYFNFLNVLFRNKLFENQLNIGSLDSLKLEYLSDYKERECSIKLNSASKIIMSLQIGTVFHAGGQNWQYKTNFSITCIVCI